MRVKRLSQRAARAVPVGLLLKHGWRAGFVALALVLLTARGASDPGSHAIHLAQHPLAAAGSLGPTTISCNEIQADTTWDAAHSPYILPYNFNNDPAGSTDPNACPDFPRPGQISTEPFPPGVVIPSGVTLTIDASDGPVQIFSHGAGLFDQGGQIISQGTGLNADGTYHTITFDAEPDVASWDGLWITTGTAQLGAANLDYTGIQHALTAINIDSGSTTFSGYGLVFTNGAIGPSYFDGIDSTNTPVQLIGQGDGRFGTLNNIGSQGLKLTFNTARANALDVEKEVFGSSVPFAETSCLPLQPCAAGTIGNDAILANFTGQRNVTIAENSFFRAGSFGIDLENAVHPQITNNDFVCNGSGSPTPVTSCVPNGTLLRSSAIYLNGVTADLPDDTSNQWVAPQNNPPAASGVSNNFGQQNGLDALVLSGTVNSSINWKTPTNDSNAPDATHLPQRLGFMVGNVAGTGGLQLNQASLTLKSGDVVKVIGGGITLTGGTLNAGGGGLKTFTSMRDNSLPTSQAIQACPSIFVQSCPSVFPTDKESGLSGEEWAGINLIGATANLNDANILFATNAVAISGTPTAAYDLQLTNSFIGPTFSDSVVVKGVPALIQSTKFCRIDTTVTPEACFASAHPAAVAGPGARGINADYSGSTHSAGGNGLTVIGNDFEGSTNEGILGTALTGWPVMVETNAVNAATAYGIQLVGSDNLTLEANTVNQSGFGDAHAANPVTYPALYLNDVLGGNFDNSTAPAPPAQLTTAQLSCAPNCIRWNSGSGNAINAMALHGTSSSLTWISPTNATGPLGYLLDNSLGVAGDLTLNPADVAEVAQGSISVSGKLSAAGALFTSFKEPAGNVPTNFPPMCGSVFDAKTLGPSGAVCPAPAAGDWGGLVLTNTATQSTISSTVIRFASTGILANGPLSVLGGSIAYTTAEGILDSALAPTQQVRIEGVAVDNAGTYGIHLVPATNLNGGYIRLIGNRVTNSGTGNLRYPAIAMGPTDYGNFLPPTGAASALCVATTVPPAPCVQGNLGGGNGVNALVFHGTMGAELDWVTAQNATAAQPQQLGYLLDGTLNMGGNQLTVKAGDVVKVAPSSLIDMAGGALAADNTDSASQKVFTTLADNSTGLNACPSLLISDCSVTTSKNYWSGILMDLGTGLTPPAGNGSLVNANIRYASTAIDITSGATSTIGSSSFGLVVSHSSIGPASGDAIDSVGTSISVANSTIGSALHGIDADLTSATSTPALFLSGNRLSSTGADAILGQGLTGRPVWLSDNHITGSGTFGIRLLGADELVLRNNNVSTSGIGATRYPAVYLPGVTADFTNDVRGNVGQGNGINALLFDGTANGNMTWRTPQPTSHTATEALGYMLDGPLTLQGGNLTVGKNDVVKGLGGAITINGGMLTASGPAGTITFSSIKDDHNPVATYASCPSFLASCGAAPGDWGGLVLTGGSGGTIDHSLINYAGTGIYTDSGPIKTLTPNLAVTYTTIVNTKQDGINSVDTPIDVEHSYIGDGSFAGVSVSTPNIGRYGILASLLGPANCPTSTPGCARLSLKADSIAATAKDGIAATGLAGEPVDIEGNTVMNAATYGMRLVGSDQLILANNIVNGSGGPATALRYPAVYLNGVKDDFETSAPTPPIVTPIVVGNTGSGNGIDGIVMHGEATKALTWLTTGLQYPPSPPAPPLPDDHHFGYLVDGPLTVDGDLTTNPGDVVKVLNGALTVSGNLTATGTATEPTTFTSLGDESVPVKACNDSGPNFSSVFVQLVSNTCPVAPGDWTGITVGGTASLTYTAIKYDDSLTVSGGSLSFMHGGMSQIKSNGIVASGHAVTITDLVFDHVAGTSIKLQNATADLERNTFTNDGTPAVQTSGAPVTLQCSSIQSGGVAGDAHLTVKESDFVPGVGVSAPAGASVENNWWGQPGGPSGQLSGGIAPPATYFATQNPTATIAVTGKPSTSQTLDNNRANNDIGTGLVQATLTFSRNMNTSEPVETDAIEAAEASEPDSAETQPDVTYSGSASEFQGAWSDPRTWAGTDPIANPVNGAQVVSAMGFHDCVPDPQHNLMITPATQTFHADTSTLPIVTVNAADQIGKASARLHGHIDPNGWATGTTSSGQFVLTNVADATDHHSYPTAALSDKTTATDVTVTAIGLTPGQTYSVELDVPSVNGTVTKIGASTLTTLVPSKVVLTAGPPASVAAGSLFSVTAQVQDSSGTLVIDDTTNVSLAIVSNPSAGTLLGTTTVAASGGVASFTGLSIQQAGIGYKIGATDGGLTGATSASFDIVAATASKLVFHQQPTDTATNGTISPSVTVQVEDQYGNVRTQDTGTENQVKLTLTVPMGATLAGTTTENDVAGVATFNDLSINTAGTYTLTAASGTLTSATSDSFTIGP